MIPAYAPHMGRSDEEKDNFGDAVCGLMADLKKDDIVEFGGDLHGHVGKSNDGYEGVHGGHGVGGKNIDG